MSRMIRSVVGIGLTVVAAAAAVTVAQTQPAAAEQQGERQGEPLEATITGIEGMVQVRQNPDAPWVKAQVGMKLGEAAEFRTGPRSAVRCTLPPDQTFTLDRLGTVSLAEAVREGNAVTTDLTMKYGRVRLDVEAAGVEHRSIIRSPSSTLAVRGTKVSLYDQRPFRAEAVSLTGRAQFRTGKKQILFGARNKAKVDVDQPSAAALALTQTTLDPTIALARTDAEANLVSNVISSGSTVFFDREAGIKVVTGGIPPTDAQLIPTLPGVVNFVARWQTNADLNFSVATPGGAGGGGEVLYPIGALAANSSGGRVAFDHRGGPNGGIEVIYYRNLPPDGLYGMGLTLISGEPTAAQVDVFKDGQRLQFFDGQQVVQSATVQVEKPIPGFVDGTAVGVVPIGVDLPIGVTPSAATAKASPARKSASASPAAANTTGKRRK